jgi:hypothetical protein
MPSYPTFIAMTDEEVEKLTKRDSRNLTFAGSEHPLVEDIPAELNFFMLHHI